MKHQSQSTSDYLPLSPPQNGGGAPFKTSTLSTIAGPPSQSTKILQSCRVVIIGLILFTSAIFMVIFILMATFCYYYCVLCVYQFVIIIHYGIPFRKYVISDKVNNNVNRTKSCCHVIYGYYFNCKILFGFLYCIITAVLLFMHYTRNNQITHCSVVEPISYILGAFSIPLPLICLIMYAKASDNQNNRSMSVQMRSSPSPRSVSTQSTKLFSLKPLRQEIIKFCTGTVYISHAICYILYPILHWDYFIDETNQIYHKTDPNSPEVYDVLYVSNQLFFRSFIGMLLIQTIFAFVLVLFDPLHQFIDKKWKIFKLMIQSMNKIKKAPPNKRWMYAIITILCCVLVADVVQLLSRKTLNVAEMKIKLKFQHDDVLCKFINILWMAIHFMATNVCLVYTMNFHAIANKRRRKKSNANKVSDLNVNQTAFVTQTTVLLILFVLNITYLYQDGHQKFNIIRQMFIAAFMTLQGSSLYFSISLPPKRARKSFRKNNWRANNLIPFYFQFLMLINIYDFLYLSAFKMTYFHQYGLDNNDHRLSYSFSFSSLALLSLFIHQLIRSYGVLNKEIDVPHQPNDDLEITLSEPSSAADLRDDDVVIDDEKSDNNNHSDNALLSTANIKNHNEMHGDHGPRMTAVFDKNSIVDGDSLLINSSIQQQ